MKNFCFFSFLILFLSVLSCVSVQDGNLRTGKPIVKRIPSGAVDEVEAVEDAVGLADVIEAVDELSTVDNEVVNIQPEIPKTGIYIMGKGRVDEEKLALFLVQNSPYAQPDFARIMASLYIEEAAHEGIDHDIAFSQMCLETGFLSFGGLVQPEWNNFCGLGAIGPEQPGLVFPDLRTGVRAHIQHLKAYATSEPLNHSLVDPRYRYVRLGSSPTIEGLAGTWAADRMYSEKILGILQRLYAFAF